MRTANTFLETEFDLSETSNHAMAGSKMKAKDLILNLFRTSPSSRWPVRILIDVAQLFDISANSIRVTLSRLRSDDLIEQDLRGHYRLNWKYDPVRDWIDSWSKGETRTISWNDQWLIVVPSTHLPAKTLRALDKACFRLGFRAFRNGFWVRPDNLAMPVIKMTELIEAMSGTSEFIISKLTETYVDGEAQSFASLWKLRELEEMYRRETNRLKGSVKDLDRAAEDIALRESFLIGGDAIRRLALDPLLPPELIDVAARSSYTDCAREYVAKYNKRWQDRFGSDTMDSLIS
jgi:phenylacetic acid degradation operon negative regulatory protein